MADESELTTEMQEELDSMGPDPETEKEGE